MPEGRGARPTNKGDEEGDRGDELGTGEGHDHLEYVLFNI